MWCFCDHLIIGAPTNRCTTNAIALFRRLPDVVNVDGTDATNSFGYKLYTLLITDGMGTGHPVMYAFVECEPFAPMRKLFDLFRELMREQYPVKTFFTGTFVTQMRTARVVFGCETHSTNSRHIFHRTARLDNKVNGFFVYRNTIPHIPARFAASAPHRPTILLLSYAPVVIHNPKKWPYRQSQEWFIKDRIALFRRLPDVVNVDGTDATNSFGYKLYTLLITDGMGTGHPVMYAFVECEPFAPMRKLFDLFRELMREQYPVKTFFTGTFVTQMRTARVVFGCETHSTNSRHIFHRTARLDNKVNGFFVYRNTIPHIPARFAASAPHRPTILLLSYAPVVIHNPKKWPYRQSQEWFIKDRVHHTDTLKHATKKVPSTPSVTCENLRCTSYQCNRRQILNGDGYLLNVVDPMNTYACFLVLRHLESTTNKATLS
ncbi:hypothetical protein CSKR_104253 [Clonorchis sinensis]|uniref:ZSWIM1/3 RNaseH-like domain-containing protein n=1 Tax=Clonorchis sinensis TaxID=79923 RepID=A0A419QD43_CLOSI|nr:hypothetical protein CSKR_104253 [Clonorchis sinensis]